MQADVLKSEDNSSNGWTMEHECATEAKKQIFATGCVYHPNSSLSLSLSFSFFAGLLCATPMTISTPCMG